MSNLAFEKTEEIIEKMLYAMDGNDDFLRLIYIDKRSALTDPVPSITYKELIKEENRLFPTERIEEPNEDEKSVVAIDWLSTTKVNGKKDIYKLTFSVDVYTSTSTAMCLLNGTKLRVPRLAQIVIDSILALDFPVIGNKLKMSGATKMYYDSDRKFKGIRVIFDANTTILED